MLAITSELIDPPPGVAQFRGQMPAPSAGTSPKEIAMNRFSTFLSLRSALLLDAVASGATALLLLFGGELVAGLFGLPVDLLRGAGLVLVPYVAMVILIGSRTDIRRAAVWLVIAANVLWTVASFSLMFSGWIAPTALGYAFIAAQAIVVALFGELQYVGLRRKQVAAA
jgi:hypothetical protein